MMTKIINIAVAKIDNTAVSLDETTGNNASLSEIVGDVLITDVNAVSVPFVSYVTSSNLINKYKKQTLISKTIESYSLLAKEAEKFNLQIYFND